MQETPPLEETFPSATIAEIVPSLGAAAVGQEGSGMRKLSLFSSDGRGNSPTRTNTSMTPSLGASRPGPRSSNSVHMAGAYGSLHNKAEKQAGSYGCSQLCREEQKRTAISPVGHARKQNSSEETKAGKTRANSVSPLKKPPTKSGTDPKSVRNSKRSSDSMSVLKTVALPINSGREPPQAPPAAALPAQSSGISPSSRARPPPGPSKPPIS